MAFKKSKGKKSGSYRRGTARRSSGGRRSSARGGARRASNQTLRIVIEQPTAIQTTPSGQLAVEKAHRKARF